MKKSIKSFLARFLIFTLVFASVIALSVKFAFKSPAYSRYSDEDWEAFNYVPEYNHSKWNVLIDFHSHTYYSDGHLSPRQNILWHIAMGFDAFVLTDHNTFEGVEEIRNIARTEFNDSIKVLRGLEWTTNRCHLNIILPPNLEAGDYEHLITFSSYTYTPTDEEIIQFIDDTHSLGGLVTVNHIPWSERYCTNQPSREQFLEWGVDFIEVINENEYDRVSEEFCLENDLGIITGTDMHEAEAVYAWSTLNVTTFSEEKIFDAIKEKNIEYIYDGSPSPYPIKHQFNPVYALFYPFIKLGEMFDFAYSSDDFGAILTTIFVYPYVFFFIVEGGKITVKKIGKKEKEQPTK